MATFQPLYRHRRFVLCAICCIMCILSMICIATNINWKVLPSQSSISAFPDVGRKRKCFLCGYLLHPLAKKLFPETTCKIELTPQESTNAHDILFYGLYGKCNQSTLENFPGTIVIVNGESPIDPILSVPNANHSTQRQLYLGPTKHHEQCFGGAFRFQFFYVTFAALMFTQRDHITITDMMSAPRYNSGNTSVFYQNSHCVGLREDTFKIIAENLTNGILSASKDHWPVAAGKCFGGRQDLHQKEPGSWNMLGKRENLFVFAMENKMSRGYITEKLLRAFLMGSVPIYWGTSEVFDLFNERAFLSYDPDSEEHNLKQLVERINHLISHPQEYHEALSEPIFTVDSMERYFFKGNKLRRSILSALDKASDCPLAAKANVR